MEIVNLLEIEPKKVSRNINDYSLMLTAPSGYGKSPFLAELYGKDAIMLCFENSDAGLAGVFSAHVNSYQELLAYIMQLENPAVRERYSVCVIDTLNLFENCCTNAVTDAYGKDLVGDCLKWNKGYKIVDKRFLDAIKRIQAMDYTMVYVCHNTEKKMTLPDGTEIPRLEPDVSDRIKKLLIPEVDIRLFAHYNENGEKVIYTQATPYFDARVRVAEVDPTIPFDAKILREEFAKGVEKKVKDKSLIVDSLEKKNPVDYSKKNFKETMEKVMELGMKLDEAGKGQEANSIVYKELGLDDEGNQRTLKDVNESMVGALEVIQIKLQALLDS